jgi:hypothetical protein
VRLLDARGALDRHDRNQARLRLREHALTSPARTARLSNVTDERIEELVDANLGALEVILRWNRSRGIQVFRLTSNLIPFGSHPANTLPWWGSSPTASPVWAASCALPECGSRPIPGNTSCFRRPARTSLRPPWPSSATTTGC